jgi:hypothetical protein
LLLFVDPAQAMHKFAFLSNEYFHYEGELCQLNDMTQSGESATMESAPRPAQFASYGHDIRDRNDAFEQLWVTRNIDSLQSSLPSLISIMGHIRLPKSNY